MGCSANRRIRLARILSVLPYYAGLSALLISGSAGADQRVPVSRGERIRVTSTVLAPGSLEGSLVNLEGDTLVMAIEPDSQAVVLALTSVRTFEVSRRVTHKVRYAGIGLLVGGGIGALIGAATYRPCQPEPGEWICLDMGRSGSAAAGAIVVGVPLAILGLLVGMTESQQWIPLHPAKLRLTWLPDDRGATVSALIRF
jgi:hypothetical protein